MTSAQLQILRDRIKVARQPVDRADSYAYPRGWNGALDHVERLIKDIFGDGAS